MVVVVVVVVMVVTVVTLGEVLPNTGLVLLGGDVAVALAW